MNIRLSLDDKLAAQVRKVAAEPNTNLAELVREYLESLLEKSPAPEDKAREREALERSFQQLQFRIGKRTWKRAELYERT